MQKDQTIFLTNVFVDSKLPDFIFQPLLPQSRFQQQTRPEIPYNFSLSVTPVFLYRIRSLFPQDFLDHLKQCFVNFFHIDRFQKIICRTVLYRSVRILKFFMAGQKNKFCFYFLFSDPFQ